MEKMLRHLVRLTGVLVFILLASVFFSGGKAFAAERVWTGASGNGNLATAENWQGGAAPSSGDSLLFNNENTLELNNNLSSDITIDGITLSGGRVKLDGNLLKISGSISGSHITFENDIQVVGDLAISTETFIVEGVLSGAGNINYAYDALDQHSQGMLMLNNSNPNFTGNISTVKVAVCATTKANSLGSATGSTTVISGNLLFQRVTGNASIGEPLVLSNSTIQAWAGICNAGGGGNLPKDPYTVTLTAPISATGDVSYIGTVDMVISGNVTGVITVKQGSLGNLTINGNTQQSPIETVELKNSEDCKDFIAIGKFSRYIISADCTGLEVLLAGKLMGVGSVGTLYVEYGGIIAPGNSPGVLSTGNLVFENGGIYEFEISGNDPGQYDQIDVTGTVELDNGVLRVIPLDFTPSQGQQYIIIKNDGTDPVEGTFAGLSEGSTVEVDGKAWFTISYKGGDGNDVVLTTIPGVGDSGLIKGVQPLNMALIIGMGLIVSLVAKRRFVNTTTKRR